MAATEKRTERGFLGPLKAIIKILAWSTTDQTGVVAVDGMRLVYAVIPFAITTDEGAYCSATANADGTFTPTNGTLAITRSGSTSAAKQGFLIIGVA